ncbi:MAG: hypothetical protein Q4B26_00260 [Eubacteriales bacterium]|nr:hypothetical protein [Eubacteriales bacterium]
MIYDHDMKRCFMDILETAEIAGTGVHKNIGARERRRLLESMRSIRNHAFIGLLRIGCETEDIEDEDGSPLTVIDTGRVKCACHLEDLADDASDLELAQWILDRDRRLLIARIMGGEQPADSYIDHQKTYYKSRRGKRNEEIQKMWDLGVDFESRLNKAYSIDSKREDAASTTDEEYEIEIPVVSDDEPKAEEPIDKLWALDGLASNIPSNDDIPGMNEEPEEQEVEHSVTEEDRKAEESIEEMWDLHENASKVTPPEEIAYEWEEEPEKLVEPGDTQKASSSETDPLWGIEKDFEQKEDFMPDDVEVEYLPEEVEEEPIETAESEPSYQTEEEAEEVENPKEEEYVIIIEDEDGSNSNEERTDTYPEEVKNADPESKEEETFPDQAHSENENITEEGTIREFVRPRTEAVISETLLEVDEEEEELPPEEEHEEALGTVEVEEYADAAVAEEEEPVEEANAENNEETLNESPAKEEEVPTDENTTEDTDENTQDDSSQEAAAVEEAESLTEENETDEESSLGGEEDSVVNLNEHESGKTVDVQEEEDNGEFPSDLPLEEMTFHYIEVATSKFNEAPYRCSFIITPMSMTNRNASIMVYGESEDGEEEKVMVGSEVYMNLEGITYIVGGLVENGVFVSTVTITDQYKNNGYKIEEVHRKEYSGKGGHVGIVDEDDGKQIAVHVLPLYQGNEEDGEAEYIYCIKTDGAEPEMGVRHCNENITIAWGGEKIRLVGKWTDQEKRFAITGEIENQVF